MLPVHRNWYPSKTRGPLCENLPMSHVVHTPPSTTENPILQTQLVGVWLPANDVESWGQFMHWSVVEFSSVEYWPDKQSVHNEFPFKVLYLPAIHPVHFPPFSLVTCVNPLLHIQALDDMLPTGEFEFEWQSEHALYTYNSSKLIMVNNESALETMKIHWPDNWQLYVCVTFESSFVHWMASLELSVCPILTSASRMSLLQQTFWRIWTLCTQFVVFFRSWSRIQLHSAQIFYHFV